MRASLNLRGTRLEDRLGDPLDDRSLADPRLADEDRVVLATAGEHLDARSSSAARPISGSIFPAARASRPGRPCRRPADRRPARRPSSSPTRHLIARVALALAPRHDASSRSLRDPVRDEVSTSSRLTPCCSSSHTACESRSR